MSRLLWCCALMLALLPAVQATEHLNDHETICRGAPQQDCLSLLALRLAQAKAYSVLWYQLKSYQLDYLFDKHQEAALAQETNQLLQLEDVPPVFRTQLYFYQAKILHANGQLLQAQHYADLAASDLSHLYQAFSDPLRLVELANLYTVVGQQSQAWQLLQQAEWRFAKSKDPVFFFELYTNKALVQHARRDLAAAAYSRKQALDAILPTGDKGKISVAYGNLGRTYQLLGQLGLAQQYNQLSLDNMTPGADDVRRQMRLLRVSQLHCQLQQPAAARQVFSSIRAELLEPSYHPLYTRLQQQLAAAQPECSSD